MKNWYLYLIALVALFVLIKQCEQEPKIKTVTKTEYVKVTDTITKMVEIEVPKTVYVTKVKTVKGKDSIVYVDASTPTAITATQYTKQLKSNNATANLKITTTGELLDVTGTINYTQENTTTTITKVKAKSGLFLYGQASIAPNPDRFAIGLDYQVRNTFLIGASASYNNITKDVYVNAKLGIRIF